MPPSIAQGEPGTAAPPARTAKPGGEGTAYNSSTQLMNEDATPTSQLLHRAASALPHRSQRECLRVLAELLIHITKRMVRLPQTSGSGLVAIVYLITTICRSSRIVQPSTGAAVTISDDDCRRSASFRCRSRGYGPAVSIQRGPKPRGRHDWAWAARAGWAAWQRSVLVVWVLAGYVTHKPARLVILTCPWPRSGRSLAWLAGSRSPFRVEEPH
jgi:hypothetical protein